MTTTPQTICGHEILTPLREDSTLLAVGPGGRPVVLKRLEADCLLRGDLHPSVRERLERVRELAHAGVANFHGVGREGTQAWLIWEYLHAEPIDAYAADLGRSAAEVRGLARELALTVDSLHRQGIVHGALVPANVLAGSGGIRLTHVSPLLFTDPAVDLDSVLSLLEHILDCRGERHGPLGNVLANARSAGLSLAMIASRLAVEPTPMPEAQRVEGHDAPIHTARRRALAAAAIVTAAAIAGGTVLWQKLDPRPAPPVRIVPGSEISIRH